MTRNIPQTLLIAWCIGCGLCGSIPARAEEPAAPQKHDAQLAEADAVRMALAHSHDLTSIENAVRAEERRFSYAGYAVNNPELRIQKISTKYFFEDENKQFQVGLRWHPPKLGELSLHEQRDSVALWEKKVKARIFRLRLVAEVRKLYAEVSMLQRHTDLSAALVEIEGKRVATIEGLVKIGQSPLLNQIKARKRLMKARSDLGKVKQRCADAKKRLAELTGAAAEAVLPPGEPPEQPVDLDHLHAIAMANRPEVQLTEERSKLVKLQYRIIEMNPLHPAGRTPARESAIPWQWMASLLG